MKAVIFDLDGVLCSTDEFHYKAWKMLSDEKGIVFNRKINERLRGIGRLESYKIILDENSSVESDDEMQEAINHKNELYRNFLSVMDFSFVSDEVRNTLIKLKEKGIKIAVGSSSKNAPYIMKKTYLDKYFEVVVDGSMLSKSKPDPEVFLKAANLLNVDAVDTLVVEDAVSGVQAALAGGMVALAYHQPELDMVNERLYKIENISDVLKFI
jgi:beta-phosphoglucomutase